MRKRSRGILILRCDVGVRQHIRSESTPVAYDCNGVAGSPRHHRPEVNSDTRDSFEDEAESTRCRPEKSRGFPHFPRPLLVFPGWSTCLRSRRASDTGKPSVSRRFGRAISAGMDRDGVEAFVRGGSHRANRGKAAIGAKPAGSK